MNLQSTSYRLLGSLIFLFLSLTTCLPEPKKKADPPKNILPNIVFLLIDDLGMSSVPTYGNPSGNPNGWTATNGAGTDSIKYKTPNLFSFGQEARVYTNMYATSLCAPSRGQLITGRYPYRNGIVFPGWELGEGKADFYPNNQSDQTPIITDQDGYLDPKQVGYPDVLRAVGYQTAFGGKWNLRYGQTMGALDGVDSTYMNTYVPKQKEHLFQMGFDTTFSPVALVGNTIDYYPPELQDKPTLDEQYLPNELAGWMRNILIEGRQQNTPQYIHYCFGLIHDPYGSDEYGYSPPPRDSGLYNNDAVWADKMEEVDLLLGQFVRLIDSLDQVNGTETMIIVAGDNGTEPNGENDNYFSKYNDTWVQGGKFSNYTHGSRVPFMVRWPGVVPDTVDHTLTDFADIFPTMVELVNGEQALDSLVGGLNDGFTPSYKGGLHPVQTDSSYVIDGQSLLFDMTEGKMGGQISPRAAVYAQTSSQAFLANEAYQLRINSNSQYTDVLNGFFKINDETLLDSTISSRTLIGSIGAAPVANPFQGGTADSIGYADLIAYYFSLFPNAGGE